MSPDEKNAYRETLLSPEAVKAREPRGHNHYCAFSDLGNSVLHMADFFEASAESDGALDARYLSDRMRDAARILREAWEKADCLFFLPDTWAMRTVLPWELEEMPAGRAALKALSEAGIEYDRRAGTWLKREGECETSPEAGRWDACPKPSEFMVRGYDVADMMALQERWSTLTPADKAALGFIDDADERVRAILAARHRSSLRAVTVPE